MTVDKRAWGTYGKGMLVLSLLTRTGVLLLLCFLAFSTEYANLKMGYNNARLVELSSGKAMRIAYEWTDSFLSLFGDPVMVARDSGGMTWSIRILGVPFTDPIAALSLFAKHHKWTWSIGLGLIAPLTIAFFFGRVFCAYICPASLVFFVTSRIRQLLGRFFYFPDFKLHHGVAWGVLAGGIIVMLRYGHGVWTLILPYFSMGQTIFQSIAFGTLSVAAASLGLFVLLDVLLGKQFTCRYICPTGRLLGWLGQNQVVTIRRDAPLCVESCRSCADVCPLSVNPKIDETRDCSMCGECLTICPTQCLSVGRKK